MIAAGHFIGPVWLPERIGSICKVGSTKMMNDNTGAAGIDIGKTKLDLALSGRAERWQFPNDDEGRAALVVELSKHGIARVGLEASGGYERDIVDALRHADFDVILFQPRQVHAYAVYRQQRAKTDAIDAGLIAACAAEHGPGRDAPDPRIAALSEPLRLLGQIESDIVQLKTRREAYRDETIRAHIDEEIRRLKLWRSQLKRSLLAALKAHDDLKHRLDLVLSVPGIGPRTALILIIHMPELGTLSREQAASLAGLAPFNDDSASRRGQRHIAGGRSDVRTALYAAALPAAFRWNKALVSLYARLTANGKAHKQALVACARKLLIFVNTVLQRQSPWIPA
jgi:transposase